MGYDNPPVRRYLRRRGITARIARIGTDSSERLGRHRWVVERTNGWLMSCKRLALRYDRTEITINALARLAVILICARRLPTDQCIVFYRAARAGEAGHVRSQTSAPVDRYGTRRPQVNQPRPAQR